MDLIRTYCEIAFSKVAMRWLSSQKRGELISDPLLPLDEDCFLDEARIHHPELSDDNLRMIYQLGKDDWSRYGYSDASVNSGNILRVVAFLAKMLLREDHSLPLVRFPNLFRWREVTQLLGEDLFTCAFLAFEDKSVQNNLRTFIWPSVAHNDNPDLNFLFRTKRLCELHSHLKASTNTCEISWVSLMNHIEGRDRAFQKLGIKHEPSRQDEIGQKLYRIIKKAAVIRWKMYLALKRDVLCSDPSDRFNVTESEIDSLDSDTALERNSFSRKWIPDYVVVAPDSPISVYAGERKLMYGILKRIYSTDDRELTFAFYRYILSKNLLRSFIIQTNNNIGFSNFQRYQDLKAEFLAKEYKPLLESLPMWEAKNHNYTEIFESRIVPVKNKSDFLAEVRMLNRYTYHSDDLNDCDSGDVLKNKDWLLIFHFLKRKYDDSYKDKRDHTVRKNNKEQGVDLSNVGKMMKDEGIDGAVDAASSEFACRPETFSQVFRFLRYYGFDATFHAGEDFYDLADGLRSVDETISLLQLRAGDRIGHALALGIDADFYYRARHFVTAMPKQWMLDNVVWLLMKSKVYGVEMDSKTNWFLNDTYKALVNDIGYSKGGCYWNHQSLMPDISDYWEAMALRGDAPDMYGKAGTLKECFSPSPDTWDHYAFVDSQYANFIRKSNPVACMLYQQYHEDKGIREKGNMVKAFKLPIGFSKLITLIQDSMIRDISKRQLCIECCPSSNVRIGRLDRFDNHPIFRFAPVIPEKRKHPLSVTVNTDDLGVFSTSLPNEYSLLALALLKKNDSEGKPLYTSDQVYDWIGRLIDNGYKFTFVSHSD